MDSFQRLSAVFLASAIHHRRRKRRAASRKAIAQIAGDFTILAALCCFTIQTLGPSTASQVREENFWFEFLPLHQYVSRFRLQKSQVKFVYEIVLKYWRLRPGKRGRPLTLHPMVCLHMFLMRVASSMHLENIRIMFHVSSISSVWRACDRIMRIFTKPSVVRYFIRWPKANEREPLNAELFPRCPTALDGCHFRIHPPAVMR